VDGDVVGRIGPGLLALVGVVLTLGMWERGIAIHDAAPLLDALTTALSLLAQWLLMRRQLENWLLWIAADLVYVPLYLSKDLPLTAMLYALFLLMCLRGLGGWRAIARRQAEEGQGA
jgi:nicotinamide mononucleotide transporter